jgi:YidC/Oxa1 family membrane protein insertase
MQQNENNGNFMDSRTISALVLVGLVWFGWQSYLSKKYPTEQVQSQEQSKVTSNETTNIQGNENAVKNNGVSAESVNNAVETKVSKVEELHSFENDFLKTQISSQGMAIKNLSLKKYKERDGNPIAFNDVGSGNFETYYGNQPVFFNIEQKEAGIFIGLFKDEKVVITKTISFKNYLVDTELKIESLSGSPLSEIRTSLNDKRRVKGESHFWAPSLETQSLLVKHSEGDLSESFYISDKEISHNQPRVNFASLNTHYFTSVIIDKSEILPEFFINHKPNDESISGFLVYKPANDSKSAILKYGSIIAPKELSLLNDIDSNLTKVISFGVFSFIAKPMLVAMRWFYSIFGNWGLSIILLTLLVRMIVMPLHIMSFRSMKTMQKIQPMIQSLREKYKDDSMALNREMMDLMKKNKVNPLSGCLPMLLQIPVFFALYSVFGQSIELYMSPFFLWIKDLSAMDPYYVLPILMAVVMYLQQKMTPSNMDPAQAKVMQFLPIIFSLMMLTLPSALTLYIFVSTLFGIIQQYFFLRDKNSVTANEVKA